MVLLKCASIASHRLKLAQSLSIADLPLGLVNVGQLHRYIDDPSGRKSSDEVDRRYTDIDGNRAGLRGVLCDIVTDVAKRAV